MTTSNLKLVNGGDEQVELATTLFELSLQLGLGVLQDAVFFLEGGDAI